MRQLEVGSPEMGVLSQIMRKVDFFAPLTMGQVERVLASIMLYEFGAGERVFAQGERGDAFYIVYQGSVEVRLRRFLFLSKTVARIPAGGFFGEIALISDEPRTATIVCAEPTRLFTLIADDFRFVLQENPSAAEEMKRIAARRKFASNREA